MEDLIGSIYDAAVRPEGWNEILGLVARKLHAAMAAVATVSPEGERFHGTVGLEPAFRDTYLERWLEIPGIDRSFAATHQGDVWITSQMVPIEVLERSTFYNEWSRPQGVKFAISGIVRRTPDSVSYVGAVRAPRFGDPTDEEVSWFRELMPHFCRVAEIRHRLGSLDFERKTAADVLDSLAVGVVLLDLRGRIVFANAAARELSREAGGLRFARDGLRAPLESETSALRALIAGATATARGRASHAGGTLAITREPPRRALHVSVSPVGGETAELWNDRRPAAAVFVTDPERGVRPVPAELSRLLGLTPTQARLTALLVEDANLAEAAERLEIAASTARNHLKEVLSRTGVRRQSELVALVLRSLPPLRT